MIKVYEALIQASEQRQAIKEAARELKEIEECTLVSRESFIFVEELLGLHRAIEVHMPDVPSRVVQFIGSRPGEGTTTVAREFARVAALKIGKRVLLLDADRIHPNHHIYFDLGSGCSWLEGLGDECITQKAFHKIHDSNLFVSPSFNSGSFTAEIFNWMSTPSFWDKVRPSFDLIVVDSSPLSSSPDALAIAGSVDGSILVVEAEKTRWTVAESAREKITKAGGNVIGMVFNKRRYHIPKWIYRRFQ